MADESGYPSLLRAAIAGAGTSRRKLAPQLAKATGNQETSEYRALGKYLAGAEIPSAERAAILAVLLREPKLAAVSDQAARRRSRLAELEERLAEVARVQGLMLDALALVLDEQGRISSRPSRGRAPSPARKATK